MADSATVQRRRKPMLFDMTAHSHDATRERGVERRVPIATRNHAVISDYLNLRTC